MMTEVTIRLHTTYVSTVITKTVAKNLAIKIISLSITYRHTVTASVLNQVHSPIQLQIPATHRPSGLK